MLSIIYVLESLAGLRAPNDGVTYKVTVSIGCGCAVTLRHQRRPTNSLVLLGFIHLAACIGDVYCKFQVMSRYNAEAKWDDDNLDLCDLPRSDLSSTFSQEKNKKDQVS